MKYYMLIALVKLGEKIVGKRLTALDIAFLGLETQRTPVNVASLQILEIPPNYKGNFVRDLLNNLADFDS